MQSIIHYSEVPFLPFYTVSDISGISSGCQFFERANESYDSTNIHRFIALRVNKSSDRLELKGTQHYGPVVWDFSYLGILLENKFMCSILNIGKPLVASLALTIRELVNLTLHDNFVEHVSGSSEESCLNL